ncbi:hypothetical protein P4C99_20230 [Pontiellaceae bacterium B1224]|nr:hypothetical protein [Pontiellaceae bacterium B1224]
MRYPSAYLVCAVWLTAATSAPAEIIWSGEQNLSGNFQYIDLNSDSLTDVLITYGIGGDTSLGANYGGLLNAHVDGFGLDGSNRIMVDSSNGYDDAALPYATLIFGTIDATYEWKGGMSAGGLVSKWNTSPPDPDTEWRGLLGENGNTYVGISFDVGESTHYGWINIALGPEGFLGFEDPITTSWAYESTPNTGIAAGAIPEPSTGILTVGGSLALLFLARARRRGTRRKWS